MTIKQAHPCAVAGELSAGSICSRLVGSATNDLTFAETIDMLNAQQDRKCVPVPDYNICAEHPSPDASPSPLPARAGAIILPTDDFAAIIIEMETMCRKLAASCKTETVDLISNLWRLHGLASNQKPRAN